MSVKKECPLTNMAQRRIGENIDTPAAIGRAAFRRYFQDSSTGRATIFAPMHISDYSLQAAHTRWLLKYPHPSAAKNAMDRVMWVGIPPSTSKEILAQMIRAESDHLAGLAEDDNWEVVLWPAEAFGFTPREAAEFLSETVFDIKSVLWC